jgi:hypothetical protein
MKRNQPGDKQLAWQLLQQVVDNDLEGKEKETAKHIKKMEFYYFILKTPRLWRMINF